ncbi:hypothetical protein I7I50_06301 [Histoplasma capsulatum G186AR]|uniref:Uncharacterized protein n=1 Tax=Ajellomyces capsulatus TaxID=5037 RepID=A0A8H8D3W1_AJECA|nr:hypothetical protein I7I52_10627 [Histoplasma capsulatum]QSS67278.1 hypothetical protein I7I50_06301 [Histoplasma capsulatum G186AR]
MLSCWDDVGDRNSNGIFPKISFKSATEIDETKTIFPSPPSCCREMRMLRHLTALTFIYIQQLRYCGR